MCGWLTSSEHGPGPCEEALLTLGWAPIQRWTCRRPRSSPPGGQLEGLTLRGHFQVLHLPERSPGARKPAVLGDFMVNLLGPRMPRRLVQLDFGSVTEGFWEILVGASRTCKSMEGIARPGVGVRPILHGPKSDKKVEEEIICCLPASRKVMGGGGGADDHGPWPPWTATLRGPWKSEAREAEQGGNHSPHWAPLATLPPHPCSRTASHPATGHVCAGS